MGEKSSLLRVAPQDYGPAYREHLLEQYKLCVEMADRVSERRMSANNYLLTVNAFLVTLYGLASALQVLQKQLWQYVVPVAGLLVCVTWFVLIRSYRQLNSAKFKVLHELESMLPTAPYDREWEWAEQGKGRAYVPLSHIETYIPVTFAGLYILLALFALWPFGVRG